MRWNKEIKSFEQGILFTLISALCLSLFGLFTKLELHPHSMTLFLFLRFFIPLLMILPFLHFIEFKKKFFPPDNFSGQLMRAISIVISQYCLFYYLTEGTLFNATMLVSIGPVIIPLLSRLLYKHHVKRITWFCMALGILGVGLILKPTSGIFDKMSIYGLIAGLGVAFSQVLYGANVEKESNSLNLLYLYLFTTILSLIPLLFTWWYTGMSPIEMGNFLFPHVSFDITYLIILSLATIGNQYFRGIAYLHAKPAALAPFLYATIIYSATFDWLVFKHVPDFMSFLGGSLVIFASFLQWAWEKRIRAI